MNMSLSPRICALVLLLCTSGIAVTGSSEDLVPLKKGESLVNYISTAVLPDGESETRMRFGDIIVREASVVKKNEAGVRKGLLLRQLASGPHIIQLIFKLGEGRASRKEVKKLLECEMINDWSSADQFRNHFREDLKRAGTNLPVPPNHLDFLKAENSTAGNLLEDDFSMEQLEIADSDAFDLEQGVEQFQNVSVRMLRNDEVIGELQRSFDMIAQQRQCRRLHRKLKKNAKHAKHDLTEDVDSADADDEVREKSSRRVRREAFRVGIMPGTLWCGDGSLADKYEDMGAHVGTDRCCREHDGCPFIIHGMQSNYGVFNYRMHTVSHCTCDERFRSCLKQTNTGSSNFVGKLFFNIVQTKCFVLKPEKQCSKRSWWGKCLKYDFKKQAHLRDPLPY